MYVVLELSEPGLGVEDSANKVNWLHHSEGPNTFSLLCSYGLTLYACNSSQFPLNLDTKEPLIWLLSDPLNPVVFAKA